jgi:hypothetical protein
MTVGQYAVGTEVPVERSRQELERTLIRYGAKRFGIMTEPTQAAVLFELESRELQIILPMPQKGGPARAKGRVWTQSGAEAEQRRRWRVMVLTLKAMLEAVESKILTFDQAFLAFMVVPGTGGTIGDALIPRLGKLTTGHGLRALLEENP